jgi:salicylate hydroxylase
MKPVVTDDLFPTIKRYRNLDETKAKMQQFKVENTEFDAFLKAKIDTFLYGDKDFIYKNDIEKVWKDYLLTQVRSK